MTMKLMIEGGVVRRPPVEITYEGLGGFEPGGRYHVLGANGSGKSTLANCISGVIPHIYDARVELAGQFRGCPLFGRSDLPLRSELTVLPQNVREFLLGLRTWDELLVSSARSTNRALMDHLYEQCGLEILRDRPCWQLSDGERQRVALASALTYGTPWFILDEWQSHLDADWLVRLDGAINGVLSRIGSGTIEFSSSGSSWGLPTRELRSCVVGLEKSRRSDITQRAEALQQLLDEFAVSGYSKASRLYHKGKLRQSGFYRRIEPFSVDAGILLVLGKNGVGKTTLLKGLRLWRRNRFSSKPTIVLSDPQLQLVGTDVSSVLALSIDPRKRHALAHATELAVSVVGLPGNQDVLELSFGSAKLLAIILGVLNKSPALAIDEPFSGLDPEGRQLVGQAIGHAARVLSKIVVITSPVPLERGLLIGPPAIMNLDVD